MKEKNTFRFRNPEIQAKTDSLLKEKNISFNQFVNDVLEDYFAQSGDKTYLQNINNQLVSMNELLKTNAGIERRNTLVNNRCMTLLLLENSKNVLEMKKKGYDPREFYAQILPESTKLIDGNNPFYKDLQEFIDSYGAKF